MSEAIWVIWGRPFPILSLSIASKFLEVTECQNRGQGICQSCLCWSLGVYWHPYFHLTLVHALPWSPHSTTRPPGLQTYCITLCSLGSPQEICSLLLMPHHGWRRAGGLTCLDTPSPRPTSERGAWVLVPFLDSRNMAQNVPASGFPKLICRFSCPSTGLTYLLPLHSLPPPAPRVPCWLGVDQSLVERLDEQSCTFSKTTACVLRVFGNLKAKYWFLCHYFWRLSAPKHGGKGQQEIPGKEIEVTLPRCAHGAFGRADV